MEGIKGFKGGCKHGRLISHNGMVSVRPQMVGFGSKHVSRRSLQAETEGLSDFETGKIACYFEDFKRAKTPPRVERCRLWTDTS